jgi:hypothetical protein
MVVTRTLKSLFWIVTLGLILVCLMASPAWADEPVGAPPLRDAPLDGPTAGEAVNGAPIPADDENFIADSGGDLDLYLFRPDRRPDGKLKFNIGIGRYYFNSEDAKEVEFDSNGFLTEDWVDKVVKYKILPARARLHLRVWDVDEDSPGCKEVDLIYINGKELKEGGIHIALSGSNDSWSEVVVDVPIWMLKFPKSKGSGLTRPTLAQNEIAIEIDHLECGGVGKPNWAVKVDYGILEIRGPVRPVVFAHGWTGNTHSFDYIEKNLATST